MKDVKLRNENLNEKWIRDSD